MRTLSNPRFLNDLSSSQTLLKEAAAQLSPPPAADCGEADTCYGGELKTLLDGFLETIIKSLGATAGAVRLLSPSGRELHIAGAVGLPPEISECESSVELGCGVCGKAMHEGAIRSVDAALCAWRSGEHFFGVDCKRIVAVPLEFRGTLIGVFNLFFSGDQEIAGDAARTLRSFAEMIGISLENARLTRENRRMSLMAERQAIANEIHDSLAQTLVYSRMRISVLQEAVRTHDELLAHKCGRDVDEALASVQKSVRELITHFRCQMDPLGLQHALQVLVNDFNERSGIKLIYANRVPDPCLPLEHELQIFHIVREVLANISTHSGATHARLQVVRKDGRYLFTIEDNGAGMSSNIPPDGHYGLTIIRERAQRIGAEIEVKSVAGSGTRVSLSFAAP